MGVECIGFRSHQKGSLLGFANFWIPKMGIEIKDCTVYMKDGARWVNLPRKEYVDKESGEKKYSNIIKFREDSHYKIFGQKALASIDLWCLNNQKQTEGLK